MSVLPIGSGVLVLIPEFFSLSLTKFAAHFIVSPTVFTLPLAVKGGLELIES